MITVEKIAEKCCCKEKCALCLVCAHKYESSCHTYSDKNLPCIHIHAIAWICGAKDLFFDGENSIEDCIHAASNDIPALSDEMSALSCDLLVPSDNQSNENEHAEYDSDEIKCTILHEIVNKADGKLLDKLFKSCSYDFSL